MLEYTDNLRSPITLSLLTQANIPLLVDWGWAEHSFSFVAIYFPIHLLLSCPWVSMVSTVTDSSIVTIAVSYMTLVPNTSAFREILEENEDYEFIVSDNILTSS